VKLCQFLHFASIIGFIDINIENCFQSNLQQAKWQSTLIALCIALLRARRFLFLALAYVQESGVKLLTQRHVVLVVNVHVAKLGEQDSVLLQVQIFRFVNLRFIKSRLDILI